MSISDPPPFANYGMLSGQLFLYGPGRAAFESALPTTTTKSTTTTPKKNKCILLGGLSDGLLPVPYTQALEDACVENGHWSLVQPILSSSYLGFGNGSLQRDCEELQELMNYLIAYRHAEQFCLIGHSTGCQDAVHFLQHASRDLQQRLRVVALQAPVSDREGAMQQDGYETNLALAKEMVLSSLNTDDDDGGGGGNNNNNDDKSQEMMPRSAFWAPITAQRYLDLFDKGGADDYFSSDYTDEELTARLQHVGTNREKLKVLVAFSGADEYVPAHVDKSLLTDRMVTAMNSNCPKDSEPVAQRLYIDTGNHNLKTKAGDGQIFVDAVAELLKQAALA